MENLKTLDNPSLLKSTHISVQEERKLTALVIRHLEEVDRRKLYLKRGYGSLIEFCIKELKYSESSAYRRISAMRVVRSIPKIEDKIKTGGLSLSVLSQAQTFIRNEEKSKGQPMSSESKAFLLQQLENKSSRESQKILIRKSPTSALPKDKVRILSEVKSELRLTLDQSTMSKLEKIKSLLSHKHPCIGYSELMDVMSDVVLKKLDPAIKTTRTSKERKAQPTERTSKAQMKRSVWNQAKGQCQYIDSKTNRRCSSRFQLQIDHIVPKSKGGLDHSRNLQLLCREHNQLKGWTEIE